MVVDVVFKDNKSISVMETTLTDIKWRDRLLAQLKDGIRIVKAVSSPQERPDANPEGSILRKVTQEDAATISELTKLEEEIYSTFRQEIIDRKLIVKVIDVELYFDKTKVIIYFCSDGFQDFKDVVKRISNNFNVRVEVKGIGVRDAAKLIPSIGSCGFQTCCSSFIRDFESITTGMAETQGLPSDPSRIAGVCGRLKCCLKFEYDSYKNFLNTAPSVGSIIETQKGKAQIFRYDVMKREVYLKYEDGRTEKIKVEKLTTS